MVYGEAYMDLTNISYFFYIYDFAQKRLTDDIKITLYEGNQQIYSEELVMGPELSIQGMIENIDPTKVYEIKVSLYLEKGFTVIYQAYVYQSEVMTPWN